MADNQIWVKKNDREERLGAQPVVHPDQLAHWTGLKIVRYRLPEEMVDRHILAPHPVLTWVCAGQASSRLRYGLGEVNTLCGADDLMFYGGGREIAYAHWRTCAAELVSVELDPARLCLLEAGDTRFSERPLVGTPKFHDLPLRHLVASLWHEVRAGCPQGQLFSDSLSLGLAVHVHRRFGALHNSRGEDRGEARARLTGAQLRRVNDYIHHHIAEPISLVDLAREAGLSRYHFTRLFTNTVGRSPYQHVLHKRLERAYHLLVETRVPVAHVALAVGFSSQSHFSTACRRVLGATPRELRERP